MAPLTWPLGVIPLTEDLVPNNTIFARQNAAYFSDSYDRDLVILMSVSLSTASISVFAALCAFYWFVRMRRSFRHDLIMLLIQSDMMKALWLVICPLGFFAKVPINSSSTFCQVSGFFLTVSIEASDFAVLLIAIHTVLSIPKPRSSRGAAGLYPYRRAAYALWAIAPIVLAAIVPLSGGRFANNGTHCYLPTQPGWYLRYLSWIPRYIIFVFIIVTYTCLYLYLAVRIRQFGRDQRRASFLHSGDPDHHQKHNRTDRGGDIPPTPLISEHGLLDSARHSLTKDDEHTYRKQSVTSTTSTLTSINDTPTPRRPERISGNSVEWNVVDFTNDGATETQARRESQTPLLSPASSASGVGDEIAIRAPESAHLSATRLSKQPGQRRSLWKHPMASVSNMVNTLRRGLPQSTRSMGSTTSGSVFLPHAETEESMRRSREKQQRQLRLLFVYPLIYMLTWISPFVAHALRYDDDYGSHEHYGGEPLSLQIVSLASLCIGAAVDCGFFSAWEKPWLHLRGGFWESLALRLRIRRPLRWSRRGAGRTSEERFVDARTARVRRVREENLEHLNNEAAAAAAGRQSPHGSRLSGTTPREWWDALDEDMPEAGPRRTSWPAYTR
ncbi:G protein-coupled glucose receptor regulating Gpa2-domain-containing protein [Hypomontagnella submonticulosa]|nr:G protein-coupled glucose receptor regulating Gpa2-domain-containing protein [Hypomontagnella submonticulosa]